ncbi:hypothetical protein Tco_0107616, partial [Tanacetum coccineum]
MEELWQQKAKGSRKTAKDDRISGSDRGVTIWDPGIKSAFLDITLRARWFRRSGECYALMRSLRALVKRASDLGLKKEKDCYFIALMDEQTAHFGAITEKEQNIPEKADTTLSLPSEEVSPVVEGALDASKDTLLS